MDNSSINCNENFKKFFEEFNNESPRGAVLVAAAYLNAQLQEILEIYLIKNKSIENEIFGDHGILSQFYKKIHLAYSLDLINTTVFKDLKTINNIRNKFAHKLFGINFENEEIIKLCNKIKTGRIVFDHIQKTPPNIFKVSTAMLAMKLGLKIVEIKRKEEKRQD